MSPDLDGNPKRSFSEEGRKSMGDLDRIQMANRTERILGGDNFVLPPEALTGRSLPSKKRESELGSAGHEAG